MAGRNIKCYLGQFSHPAYGEGITLVYPTSHHELIVSHVPVQDILYLDDDIVVVNKPSGLLCVPGRLDKDSLATRSDLFILHLYTVDIRGQCSTCVCWCILVLFSLYTHLRFRLDSLGRWPCQKSLPLSDGWRWSTTAFFACPFERSGRVPLRKEAASNGVNKERIRANLTEGRWSFHAVSAEVAIISVHQ